MTKGSKIRLRDILTNGTQPNRLPRVLLHIKLRVIVLNAALLGVVVLNVVAPKRWLKTLFLGNIERVIVNIS
jgi:hypothetical protein